MWWVVRKNYIIHNKTLSLRKKLKVLDLCLILTTFNFIKLFSFDFTDDSKMVVCADRAGVLLDPPLCDVLGRSSRPEADAVQRPRCHPWSGWDTQPCVRPQAIRSERYRPAGQVGHQIWPPLHEVRDTWTPDACLRHFFQVSTRTTLYWEIWNQEILLWMEYLNCINFLII